MRLASPISLIIVIATLLVCGSTSTRASSPEAVTRPNIILITVDTLRADHVSAYGYSRATTPNIDALIANQGVMFKDAVSPAPWTLPANAATNTGLLPSKLRVPWTLQAQNVMKNTKDLAQYLHEAGYYTAGFITNSYVSRKFGFERGFDVYTDPLELDNANAGRITDETINWVDQNWTQHISGTQPLLLWTYYIDPHTYYNPPAPYDTMYDPTYTGPITPQVFAHGKEVREGTLTLSPRDVEHVKALYDGEISYADQHIGRLLNRLQTLHVLDNAIVVLLADHGEHFGEHNNWTHGGTLYEEAIRVPLIIRYPGVVGAGTMNTTPVSSMDIMPTLLQWAGVTVPPGLDARPLQAVLSGQGSPAVQNVYSEVEGDSEWPAPLYGLRSIQQGQDKLIQQVEHPNVRELYSLRSNSVYEVDNLADSEPARTEELSQQLIKTFFPYQTSLPFIARP